MRLFLYSLSALVMVLSACDKVENIYPETFNTELDQSLYPGDWSDYTENEWPDFSTITASADRNVIIEDYTGHNCPNCPPAATIAHNLHESNPNRIFIASVHAAPNGTGAFQAVTSQYTVDFTNSTGMDMGQFFGELAGSGFDGNPSGTVNRLQFGTSYFYAAGAWNIKVDEALNSPLKVALKSHVNYYEETHGAFLHTEVEVLDASLTNLGMIVYLLEDSLVAPQNVLSTYTPDYVHRDIHRANLSGSVWGRTLTPELMTDGRYYLDYSFVVPDQLAPGGASGGYNAENMHLLIYVYDKDTYEIYQVVKQKIG